MKKVVHRGNQRFGENGTAWAYIGRDIPYTMAGKSGTAQVVGISQGEVYDEDLIDERLRKHAWFIAFAPVDDPLIAVAVLLENGGGGSENAAPVARAIIDAYLMDIVPSRGHQAPAVRFKQRDEPGVRTPVVGRLGALREEAKFGEHSA